MKSALFTHGAIVFNYFFFIPATDVYFSCGFIYNIFVCQLVLFVIKSHKLATVIYVTLIRITIYLESGGFYK